MNAPLKISFVDFQWGDGWGILLRWLQTHMIIDKSRLKNMKFEVKTSQFALNMFKIKLWGSLNFERVLLKH
jgi:hypothetical protein